MGCSAVCDCGISCSYLFDESINEPGHNILVLITTESFHQSLCCSPTEHIEDYEGSEQNLEL